MKKEELKIENIKSVEIDFNNFFTPRDILILDESIGKELWENFLDDMLNTIKIADWNKAYRDNNILDGFAWEIIIKSKNKGLITFYGVNDYPDNWEIFYDLVELIKEKINKNDGIEEIK
jgi:hypothetical protein